MDKRLASIISKCLRPYLIDNMQHSRTSVYITLYFSPRNITTAYTVTTKTFAAAQWPHFDIWPF